MLGAGTPSAGSEQPELSGTTAISNPLARILTIPMNTERRQRRDHLVRLRASALKVLKGRYDKVWFSKLGHALRSTRLVTMYDYYD